MNKHILIVAMVVIGQVLTGEPNDTTHNIGLSVPIQSKQLGIVIPVLNASHSLAILPSFSVFWAEDIGSEYAVGVGIRKYWAGQHFKPYMSFGSGLIGLKIKDIDTIFDYVCGFSSGGEYFFSNQLSIGVEAQLNFSKSDKKSTRFGNPGGITANTATLVYATIYF